jgi:streptogramin lyase
MKRIKMYSKYPVFVLSILFNIFMLSSDAKAAGMPIPAGPQTILFDEVVSPVIGADPATTKPFGVGSLAQGGSTANFRISLPAFNSPVDIYGGFTMSADTANIYLLDSAGSFKPFNMNQIVQDFSMGIVTPGVEKWKTAEAGAIDYSLGDIQISDLTPGIYTVYIVVTPAGSLNNHYLWVTSFNTARTEHIYISEVGNNRIDRINDMSGTGWTTWSSPKGSSAGQVNVPYGLYVDTTGRIYIADLWNNRIVRMDDMSGSGWTSFGVLGTGTNEFNLPTDIFVDSSGKIYIADTFNNRIVRINDMTGTGWTAFGSFGSGANQFIQPGGITVDSAGRIYVADPFNNRVVRINDMNGNGWVTLGSTNQFHLPSGVTTDSSDRIYITDLMNCRIVRIDDMTGDGWTTFGTNGSGINQFDGPTGISIDTYGKIYIVDYNRLVRIDDMTGAGWTTFGTPGSGTNQFEVPIRVFAR